ncbi:gliding motility-associated C-terminal domain-containing protein [Edaphocola aurantiacus]|uniref:gliding motility-associated C-terminal domain-containing protein n=1 Tax=Edaphocola aurantiacus TaxID=2601682 RepID=UPI001C98295B|nr:gliding motility-associated C-terminal domain-containing protein [Edaphocola aurantiacus]
MNNKYSIYLFLLCMCLSGTTGYTQGENNHWHFGNGHHLDFNSSPPTYSSNSGMLTFESSAAVSDAQGNLLFYTIGCRIWDRNGNDMPNATGLKGNNATAGIPTSYGSGQDCVQTVPNPANPNQYYVFSARSIEENSDSIYYHIVDMSLNGGLGDVVPSSKNTVLFGGPDFSLSEFMTVTYGDCNSYWYIVTMDVPYNCAYYAYKIDDNGVSTTPVISTPGFNTAYISLTGLTKILPLSQTAYRTTLNGLLRSEFNKYTGQFTNFELIPGITTFRFECSPDEQLMYITNNNGLQQLNLQLYPNLAAIASSATLIAPGNTYSDLRLAPDGKIYRTAPVTSSLARIEQPNVLGAGCTYTPLYTNTQSQTTLMRLGATALRITKVDTISNPDLIPVALLCPDDSVMINNPHQNMVSYNWDNGSAVAGRTIYQPGDYWVQSLSLDCHLYTDTFRATVIPPPRLLQGDTSICQGDAITINAHDPRLDTYLWNNGSTTAAITIHTAGTYYVVASNGPCTFTDTIELSLITPEIHVLQEDTIICAGSPLLLEATTNMNSTIRWNTGQTGASITINNAGVYTAYTENKCGLQTDSVRIGAINCNCRPIAPNAFTPNGDGRNDIFMPVFNPDCDALYYELKIYNRYGQLVYMTNRKGTGWDGTYSNNRPADAGVYFYTISLSNRYGDTDKQWLKGDITLVR